MPCAQRAQAQQLLPHPLHMQVCVGCAAAPVVAAGTSLAPLLVSAVHSWTLLLQSLLQGSCRLSHIVLAI